MIWYHIILLNIFVDSIMVIKENMGIGTHQGDKVVHNPSYIKIITMKMMILRFKTDNCQLLSS